MIGKFKREEWSGTAPLKSIGKDGTQASREVLDLFLSYQFQINNLETKASTFNNLLYVDECKFQDFKSQLQTLKNDMLDIKKIQLSQQDFIDGGKEVIKKPTEFKVGWVYKDGRGNDILIIYIRNNTMKFPILGIHYMNEHPAIDSYNFDGGYFSEKSENDLILSTGFEKKET